MYMRVLIDEKTSEVVQEMKERYGVKTNKEMVEKCIMFCHQNKVHFENPEVKTIDDLYSLTQNSITRLNKTIEDLPLKISMVLESEA